ncbi:sulfhydryl oxidase 2-like isoform X1 [Pararge aegeria]|uniref:sulfhydryl oxidase 2-like isoform X1 n=1 Tax=Pararge aegeria TaxID=116150 RepID=UPI0019D049AA|nr:sulfhydryl oxidase 2-like isoform X1 [Pararge aegeria]
MYWWQLLVITNFSGLFVIAAVIPDNDDIDEQGLYSKSDHVTILTNKNFDKKIYGQRNAFILQFYNSYCGHCRAFAPKFKSLAAELDPWKSIVKLAALDCSIEENNVICRQYEVMAYPSLRYLHENYVKSNANVGDKFRPTDSAEQLKIQLINKMQNEQTMGRLDFAPALNIASYTKLTDALSKNPKDVIYTFLIFENDNSTIGSEIALDMNDYEHVIVKRVYDVSELADTVGVRKFPGLVAVGANMENNVLSPKTLLKQDLLKAINTFLKLKNYSFPLREIVHEESRKSYQNNEFKMLDPNMVYYSDLEKTLKTSLHTEITRHKTLNNEPLQALIEYLNVIILAFPFRKNLKKYIEDLRGNLSSKNQWSGSEVYDLVIRLEATHAPVFAPDLDYVRCKGSKAGYRGYTCGLWTLFHTLTVNAAQKPGTEGPRVLRAIHGYVKHFFGCTECAEHFQAMSLRNRILDVKDNNKAVLWLWISHNEVNLRLTGDVTEDPKHPKIQFPSVTECPECRQDRGAWNLPVVYDYLQRIYGANNIKDFTTESAAGSPSPLSNLHIGMLSFLLIHRLWRDSQL